MAAIHDGSGTWRTVVPGRSAVRSIWQMHGAGRSRARRRVRCWIASWGCCGDSPAAAAARTHRSQRQEPTRERGDPGADRAAQAAIPRNRLDRPLPGPARTASPTASVRSTIPRNRRGTERRPARRTVHRPIAGVRSTIPRNRGVAGIHARTLRGARCVPPCASPWCPAIPTVAMRARRRGPSATPTSSLAAPPTSLTGSRRASTALLRPPRSRSPMSRPRSAPAHPASPGPAPGSRRHWRPCVLADRLAASQSPATSR
jgi:hypothetical protein